MHDPPRLVAPPAQTPTVRFVATGKGAGGGDDMYCNAMVQIYS
jgi:hypothetical protein